MAVRQRRWIQVLLTYERSWRCWRVYDKPPGRWGRKTGSPDSLRVAAGAGDEAVWAVQPKQNCGTSPSWTLEASSSSSSVSLSLSSLSLSAASSKKELLLFFPLSAVCISPVRCRPEQLRVFCAKRRRKIKVKRRYIAHLFGEHRKHTLTRRCSKEVNITSVALTKPLRASFRWSAAWVL